MNESQLFFKIAENFNVFSVCSEEDVKFLRSISNDKKELRKKINDKFSDLKFILNNKEGYYF